MAPTKMDGLEFISKHLVNNDGSDTVRELVRVFAEKLMSADVDTLCGAPHGERSDERVNQRNGYRERRWDTRAGSIELQIPKLRQGSYFPDWLLEPRRRAEKALVGVVAECYQRGVSTRRVDGLVKAMGIDGMSKSQVSLLAADLDQAVKEFRERPLDGGAYPYIWVDALMHKSREGGRVVNVATVVAVGVNAVGHREVLGIDVFTSEDGAAWLTFLRSLVARGLSGVRNVTADAHNGLTKAIEAVFPGASWQRCRTHFMRNLLGRVPRGQQDAVATLVRSVFMQPDAGAVRQQYGRVIDQLHASGFDKPAEMLVEAEGDLLAFSAFPKAHWKQIWSNNPQERLNKEIRRRTDVVGIFPNRDALIRLAGAVLAEQNDEWQVTRCYLNVEAVLKMPSALQPAEQAA